MTITIEMAPELEEQLQHAAAEAGLAPDVYVVETLRAHLEQPSDPKPRRHSQAQRLAPLEANLLIKINHSLDGIAWTRYHTLQAKRRAESLTDGEQQELVALSDQIKMTNAQRMTYLMELARLRNVPLASLMQKLGLKPPVDG